MPILRLLTVNDLRLSGRYRPGIDPSASVLPAFDPLRSSAVSLDVIAVSRSRAAAVRERQKTRLAALLEAAAAGSTLYRKRLARAAPGATPLADIAPTGKRELMERFDEWVTDPKLGLDALRRFTADPSRIGQPFLGHYAVWESSGSSGEPGIFVQDARALAVYDALEAFRRPPLRPMFQHWWDPWGLAERHAFVGATGGHFASPVSVERLRRLNPCTAATVRSFSFLQPTAQLVAQLNDYAPTVIATYPTAALLLAEEQAAGRLRVAPQEVWTGGEALTPAVRRFVAQSFHCAVSNSYGASEFLALAAECRCGAMHLNSDWAIVESVDAQGRAVAAGETGCKTLLTNLANHVQPLIRYELGDRITFAAQPCGCGSPLPTIEVEGRIDDALLLRDDSGRAVRLLPLALTTVLEDEAGVFDFQLVQQSANSLMLRVAANGDAGRRTLHTARDALAAYLRRQGLGEVKLQAHCGARSECGRSGKVQRVVALPAQ